MFKVPEKYRNTEHEQFGTTKAAGNYGLFLVPINGIIGQIIASSGLGWEHVSVTLLNQKMQPLQRTPDWPEMCIVKYMFWGLDSTVMQLHPAINEHVNNHEFCLHLWRPINQKIPVPPSILVGIKNA